MKRLILVLMTLVILFTGCSQPAEPTETAPEATASIPTVETVPETTEPTESTTPATLPMESTEPVPPVETTLPTETTAFQPYTIRVEDPERLIYAEPGFHQNVTAIFEEAGVYTIVEEAYDQDGNLWGRLKSGIGWVCLTEPPVIPIHADYAPEHFVSDFEWHCGETEYVTDIGILANEHITDVQVSLLNYIPEYQTEEILYTVDEMEADQALKVSVVFWGDFTTYGLSFTDAKGNHRTYALMISGKDGSLICSEYQTPDV